MSYCLSNSSTILVYCGCHSLIRRFINFSLLLQAEFAACAVDFLHRVGRTARAGQSGTVTSLYTEANRDLVRAVRQAEELAQPVVRLPFVSSFDMDKTLY